MFLFYLIVILALTPVCPLDEKVQLIKYLRTSQFEDKIYQKVQLRPIMLAAALAAILPGAPITPPPG